MSLVDLNGTELVHVFFDRLNGLVWDLFTMFTAVIDKILPSAIKSMETTGQILALTFVIYLTFQGGALPAIFRVLVCCAAIWGLVRVVLSIAAAKKEKETETGAGVSLLSSVVDGGGRSSSLSRRSQTQSSSITPAQQSEEVEVVVTDGGRVSEVSSAVSAPSARSHGAPTSTSSDKGVLTEAIAEVEGLRQRASAVRSAIATSIPRSQRRGGSHRRNVLNDDLVGEWILEKDSTLTVRKGHRLEIVRPQSRQGGPYLVRTSSKQVPVSLTLNEYTFEVDFGLNLWLYTYSPSSGRLHGHPIMHLVQTRCKEVYVKNSTRQK